jgi:plastocyanin
MKAGAFSTLIAAALLAACGGGSSSSQGNGGCTPGGSASVTIAATGVSPKAVCVLPGGTVTFTNQDSAAHDIEQNGSITSCTGLNLGAIAAGQAATAPFPAAATCGYEDAGHATDDRFQGTVAVTSVPATGPGY